MKLSRKGSYRKLLQRLEQAPRRVAKTGTQWAIASARDVDNRVRQNLDTQGRGGTPPPLSPITRELYRQTGEPDGSGIVNHLTLEFQRKGDSFVAILGIPEGKPSLVARVQDRGATIPVTDRMRGFLAAHGIFLRATTTHINVPGRHFWELALRDSRASAKRNLKRILREIFRS
ncbi:MAG: hypothetical protein SNJ57_10055 [Cyanobacteriota bacterium]